MVIWGCVHPLAAERDSCWLRITRRRWWLRELWKKTVHRAAVPSRTCWWDRIELWPTASYIPSHTAIAELLAVAGLFLNASGPSPHCFLNPYSSYAEILTTHSCSMKVADTSVIHTTLSCCTVLTTCKAQLNGLCYVFQYSEQQWIQQGCWHSYTLDSSRKNECFSHVNLIHVKLKIHSFYYHWHHFPSRLLRFYTCS